MMRSRLLMIGVTFGMITTLAAWAHVTHAQQADAPASAGHGVVVRPSESARAAPEQSGSSPTLSVDLTFEREHPLKVRLHANLADLAGPASFLFICGNGLQRVSAQGHVAASADCVYWAEADYTARVIVERDGMIETDSVDISVQLPRAASSAACSLEQMVPYWGDDAETAAEVCRLESQGDVFALNNSALCGTPIHEGGNGRQCDPTGDFSVGLFQINLIAHCAADAFESTGRYAVRVVDPDLLGRCIWYSGFGNADVNIRAAVRIWENRGGSFAPWSTYRKYIHDH